VRVLCKLLDLRKTDTGVYTCRAVSETGETTRGAALIVEAPSNPAVIFHRTPEPSTFPGPPFKPTVSEVSENSVRLTWRPSATHGASAVFAYTVEYFSHDTLEVSTSFYCFKFSVVEFVGVEATGLV
jgi:roundabout, axon guidance receptor 2